MSFAYHRSVAPMIWVLVAIATAETLVVHLVVALLWPALAICLSIVSVATIVWLVSSIRSFKRLPVVIADGELIWRAGGLKSATVSLDNVERLKADWSAADLERREVLNCALIAYPNTVVVLREPVKAGRRTISELAHRLDDPEAFASAIGVHLKHAG